MFPDRKAWEERISDGIENREVSNLERGSYRKIGGIEERLMTPTGVVIWGRMGPASSNEHIQRWWSVVANVDGKIQRMSNASLPKTLNSWDLVS